MIEEGPCQRTHWHDGKNAKVTPEIRRWSDGGHPRLEFPSVSSPELRYFNTSAAYTGIQDNGNDTIIMGQ